MKLLDKLNRRYISYSLSIMMVSGIMIYLVISLVVSYQLDEKLSGISKRIGEKLSNGGQIEWLLPFVEVSKTEKAMESSSFSDTLIMNTSENELEEYRQLTVYQKINDLFFKIIVRESKLESEDLIASLAGITLLAIIFLTGSLILVNRKVAKSIWLPFYKNLKSIEEFSLQKHTAILFEPTGIIEFDTLNEVVTKLTTQIISDFKNMKQFSEDASHEMQTPLAIISAKLESLINDSDFSENQIKIIQSANAAVQRLSKLNRELILLTRIENNQFLASEMIHPGKIIYEKLDEFLELLQLKGISVENQINDDFETRGNPLLADLLISNLLSNAINHNIQGGLIRIVQTDNKLEIWNSGQSQLTHPERLFARFYKESNSSNSVGLGLSILQKICEVQRWKVNYTFVKPLHGFHVEFENQ
jgi:signal transduction histidine kinase